MENSRSLEEGQQFDVLAFLTLPLCDVERLTPDLKGFAERLLDSFCL